MGLFFSSLAVGYSGALMPGPVTILAISQSARVGMIAAPLISLGHIGLELVVVVALVRGAGVLLRRGLVAGLIGVGGGLVLLWMGLGILQSVWTGSVRLSLEAGRGGSLSALGLVGQGVLASAANPYWVLWWATIGLSYVLISLRKGLAGLAAFYLGHSAADFSWVSFLGLAVASGRRFLSDSVYAGLLLVAGFILMGLSVYFLYTGWKLLRGKAVLPAL